MRSLGLDLGGTNIKLVVLEAGHVAERREAPTRSEDGVEAVLERLVELGRAVGPVDSVGVAINPGATTLQRIPSGAYVTAIARVNPITAAFDAA